MSRISVAVDNSVLSDLANPKLPDNKIADRKAFEEIIKLSHKGVFEIGIPISTTLIERSQGGGDKTQLIKNKMGTSWKLWPVVTNQTQQEINQRMICLQQIMQDRDGIDSKNLIASTIYTPYYLTTDYRYIRQFKAQETRIKNDCKINVFVLSPAEFLSKYKNGEI